MGFFKTHKKIVAALIIVTVVTGMFAFAPSQKAQAEGSTTGTVLKWLPVVVGGIAAVPAFIAAAPGAGLLAAGGAAATAIISHLPALAVAHGTGVVADIAEGGNPTWITKVVISTIVTLIRWLFGWLLNLTANLFEWTVQMNFLSEFSKIPTVLIGWKLLRDFTNMLFVFALLYVAIGTMLQLSGMDWKRTLTAIILAALLVNFSLFITGLFVDGSNILTMEFYNAITNDGKYHVSNMITQESAIAKVLAIPTSGVDAAKLPDSEAGWMNEIVSAGLLIVLVRFFFVTSMLFIGRIITIIFLMMTAPIAFTGTALATVLPQIKQYVDRWWTTLFNQVLLAPFIMFVLYVVLSIVPVANAGAGSASFLIKALPQGDTPMAAYLWYLQYAIIIAIISFGVTEAKKFAGEAGEAVLGIGKMGAGLLAGGVLGGMSVLGTQTIGQAASWAGNGFGNKKAKEWLETTTTGRFIKSYGFDKVAGATFDASNLKSVQKGFGFATEGGTLGQGINAGGFTAYSKSEVEAGKITAKNILDNPEDRKRLKKQMDTEENRQEIKNRLIDEDVANGITNRSNAEFDRIVEKEMNDNIDDATADEKTRQFNRQMMGYSNASKDGVWAQMSASDRDKILVGSSNLAAQGGKYDGGIYNRYKAYGDNNFLGLQHAEHTLSTSVIDKDMNGIVDALREAGSDIGKLPERLLKQQQVFSRMNRNQLAAVQMGGNFKGLESRRSVINRFTKLGTDGKTRVLNTENLADLTAELSRDVAAGRITEGQRAKRLQEFEDNAKYLTGNAQGWWDAHDRSTAGAGALPPPGGGAPPPTPPVT